MTPFRRSLLARAGRCLAAAAASMPCVMVAPVLAQPAQGVAAAPTRIDETLRRINVYRAAGATCGDRRFDPAPPLAWNGQLERTALAHASDMAAHHLATHTGSDGSTVGQRATRNGYDWAGVAENVSAGYASELDAVAGWMKSPGHCVNLMSAAYSEVGVAGAHAAGDAYGWYRAMVLARPRAPAGGHGPLAATTVSVPVRAEAVLDALNRVRQAGTRCGGEAVARATPLRWHERLARAAQEQARDNASRGAATDEGIDGTTPGERVLRAGYRWQLVGELVISSRPAIDVTLRDWLEDASSCRMLLDGQYTHVGVAGASPDSRTQDPYWVLVLARALTP